MPDNIQEPEKKKVLHIIHILRRDKLDKWDTSTIPLYYGEPALGFTSDGVLGEIRVGEDGVKSWNQLGTMVPAVTSNPIERRGKVLGFDDTTGNAILFHLYEWARQQSLLGGQQTGGTWNFNNATPAQQGSQAEVAAFIKQETTDLKIRIDQVTEDNYEEIYGEPYTGTPEQQARLGKYQIRVSTDNEQTWQPSGDPFTITLEDYTGGDTKYISIDIDDDNVITGNAKIHDIASAQGDVWNFRTWNSEENGEPTGVGTLEILNQIDPSENGGRVPFMIQSYTGVNLFLKDKYNTTGVPNDNGDSSRWVVFTGTGPSGSSTGVFLEFTNKVVEESTGLADAADVRRFVEDAIRSATANIESGNGIVVTTVGNEKYIAVRLNENAGTIYDGIVNSGSGLDLSSDGLKLNDDIEWRWNCGDAILV